MATWPDTVWFLLQILGHIILIPYYFVAPAEKTDLYYDPANKSMKQLLDDCPTLKTFNCTCWLRSPIISFMIMVMREYITLRPCLYQYEREVVLTPDGGQVALDWWTLGAAGRNADTNDKTPILIIVTTLAGDGMSFPSRTCARKFAKKGWRCVAYVKRGCGQQMFLPQLNDTPFDLLGSSDLKLCIDSIAERWPDAPLFAVGFSCGGNQVRHYMNSEGDASKLWAGLDVDSGWTWHGGCVSLDRRLPLLSQVLGMSCANGWLKYIQENPQALKKCKYTVPMEKIMNSPYWPTPFGSPTFGEVLTYLLAPGNGHVKQCSEEEYEAVYQSYCSVCDGDRGGCVKPMLALNSWNDLIMDTQCIAPKQLLWRHSPWMATAFSKSGTHVIRWTGFWARCWASKVGYEFFSAVLKQNSTKKRKRRRRKHRDRNPDSPPKAPSSNS